MNNNLIQEQIIKSQLKLEEKWLEQNTKALEGYNNWIEKKWNF